MHCDPTLDTPVVVWSEACKGITSIAYHLTSSPAAIKLKDWTSVIFVNENVEKRENNEFVNENEKMMKTKTNSAL